MGTIERMFLRERKRAEWNHTEQKRIAVAGLSHCAGATTVASGLALFLAGKGNSVSFVECADPGAAEGLFFESCGMAMRFGPRPFTDVYQKLAMGETIREIRNMEQGVNWILATPEDVEREIVLDGAMKGRLMQAPRGDFAVFDMDLRRDPGWKEWIADMDYLAAVLDPMPSRMMTNGKALALLKSLEREMAGRFTWIINRVNRGISRRQVRRFLESGHILEVPDIPAEIAYGNEFCCRIHYEEDHFRNALDPVFHAIWETFPEAEEYRPGKHDGPEIDGNGRTGVIGGSGRTGAISGSGAAGGFGRAGTVHENNTKKRNS